MKINKDGKKPKLYNILIQAIVVTSVIVMLTRGEGHRNTLAVCLIAGGFYLAAVIQLIAAFFKQIRYNLYSYNTIYYFGFAMFLLSVWVMQVYITIDLIRYPDIFGVHEILRLLLDSAKMFMIMSLPFILVFSAALCISNIFLIVHEGKRFVNILGILLAIALVGGEAFLILFGSIQIGYGVQIIVNDLLINFFAAVYLYFECMLIGAIIADVIAALAEPDPDRDFLIILGCGIRKDGTPSPLLRGRIERALDFYRRQKKETGKELIFVTSGGKGPDEIISESASMKTYLMDQGITEGQIIEEDRSTDTLENMRFSKEKIQAFNPEGKVAFSTTNYHVFRSGVCARRVKMHAFGMGSETKWWFWPNASVREFIGLLTEHRKKQAMIFSGLILSYIVLTFLYYR